MTTAPAHHSTGPAPCVATYRTITRPAEPGEPYDQTVLGQVFELITGTGRVHIAQAHDAALGQASYSPVTLGVFTSYAQAEAAILGHVTPEPEPELMRCGCPWTVPITGGHRQGCVTLDPHPLGTLVTHVLHAGIWRLESRYSDSTVCLLPRDHDAYDYAHSDRALVASNELIPVLAEHAAKLVNEYAGDNVWEDVIYGLAGYDDDTTARLDPKGQSSVVTFTDGSAIEASPDGWRTTTVHELPDPEDM